MIRNGLSLDTNGEWHVEQLYPHSQEIVASYPENFNREFPLQNFNDGNWFSRHYHFFLYSCKKIKTRTQDSRH